MTDAPMEPQVGAPPRTKERGQGDIYPHNAVIGVTVSSGPQGRALRRTVNKTQVWRLSHLTFWKTASTVMRENWAQQGSPVVSCGSQGQHPDSPPADMKSAGGLSSR